MNELERLEELKGIAIANPPKKAKGCKSCKKKKDAVTEIILPAPEFPEYIPNIADIRLAYIELINLKGVDEKAKPIINKVYEFLFKEPFDWGCNSCINTQARKFYNYCKDKKII